LGIPRVLARLGDGIFEGLNDPSLRQKFAVDYLAAIQPGADLSMVFYKFIHWLLVDPEDGVLKYAKTDRTKESITKVAGLYKQYIDGELSLEQFRKNAAADAAYAYADAADAADADAAAADAAAAAYADAADAAYAYAADAAAAAYAADAADAADAAAAYAARKKSRKKQADKLLQLMAEAPIINEKLAA
jgi:hypothetical protein